MTDSSADATDQQVAAPDKTDKPNLSVLLIGITEFDVTLGGKILPEYRPHVDLTRVRYISFGEFWRQKDALTGLCGIILDGYDTALQKRTIIDDWAPKKKITKCAVVPAFESGPRTPKPALQQADWLQFQISRILRECGHHRTQIDLATFIEKNLDPYQSRKDTDRMMVKLQASGYSAHVDAVRKIVSDIRQRQKAEERAVRARPTRKPRWKIIYSQGDYDDLPPAEDGQDEKEID
jgi:hypothetical protein